ncbi:Hypothetical protein LUCI_0820 [Lucifera butyrica]|uniref:Uncharacterized protein n=1 Tax=Lucifera butyrica TaxID=1351585 RepID=A0A498R475_9FIRM|nr:hypothetical protein [Lucifera butyrica]VBB05610.1 Hypothetical protein LUCI_0820 [Lucifera butyrica]
MRKLIVLVLLLLNLTATTVLAAPDEQEIASSFHDLVTKHINGYKEDPRVMIYFIPGNISPTVKEGWRKSKCVVTENYSYAIQKPASKTGQYTGFLIYEMYIFVSPAQPTKELAEATETFNKNVTPGVYKISFSYQDGKWVPLKYQEQVRAERTVPPVWLTITPNPLSTHFKRLIIRDSGNLDNL